MKPYYEHSGITIYHGDCREVLPQLPKGWCSTCSCVLADEQILAIHLAGEHKVGPLFELLLTDPPYGLNLSSDLWLYQRGKIAESSWDSEKFPAITSLLTYSKDAIIWGGNYYELPISRGWLSWFKPDAVPTMSQFELAWTSRDMVTRQFRYCIAETNAERCGHPTQKPIALMKWCMGFSETPRNVLDPMCGSGTTLRAAKDLGISAIGIEIEEKYCEIAAKRLSQEVFQFTESK